MFHVRQAGGDALVASTIKGHYLFSLWTRPDFKQVEFNWNECFFEHEGYEDGHDLFDVPDHLLQALAAQDVSVVLQIVDYILKHHEVAWLAEKVAKAREAASVPADA